MKKAPIIEASLAAEAAMMWHLGVVEAQRVASGAGEEGGDERTVTEAGMMVSEDGMNIMVAMRMVTMIAVNILEVEMTVSEVGMTVLEAAMTMLEAVMTSLEAAMTILEAETKVAGVAMIISEEEVVVMTISEAGAMDLGDGEIFVEVLKDGAGGIEVVVEEAHPEVADILTTIVGGKEQGLLVGVDVDLIN